MSELLGVTMSICIAISDKYLMRNGLGSWYGKQKLVVHAAKKLNGGLGECQSHHACSCSPACSLLLETKNDIPQLAPARPAIFGTCKFLSKDMENAFRSNIALIVNMARKQADDSWKKIKQLSGTHGVLR